MYLLKADLDEAARFRAVSTVTLPICGGFEACVVVVVGGGVGVVRRSFVARAEGQREGVETELERVGIAERRKKKEKEKNYEATHINLRT